METILQILSPDFLLRNSLYVNIVIGFSCPLIGVFLVLRRLIFMGVALPQISSTGVAVALCVPLILGIITPDQAGHWEHALAFLGSTVFSLAAIMLLALLDKRGKGLSEGRLGTSYVLASAIGILLLAKNRYAEVGWLDLMKGEIITVSDTDLILTACVLTFVMGVLFLFYKEILFVSFDRAMAVTLGKNILLWDVVLYTLIGLTVSISVLSVGPLITFGFLLIPVLTANLFAANMRQFLMASSILGGLTAFIGFALAYQLDWPIGPTEVVLLGLVYGVIYLIHFILKILKMR